MLAANQLSIVALLGDRANAAVVAPLRGRAFDLMAGPAMGGLADSEQLASLAVSLLDDDTASGCSMREVWASASDAGGPKARIDGLISASAGVGNFAELDATLPDVSEDYATVVFGMSSRRVPTHTVSMEADNDASTLLYAGRLLCLLAMCGLDRNFDVETMCQVRLLACMCVCVWGGGDIAATRADSCVS